MGQLQHRRHAALRRTGVPGRPRSGARRSVLGAPRRSEQSRRGRGLGRRPGARPDRDGGIPALTDRPRSRSRRRDADLRSGGRHHQPEHRRAWTTDSARAATGGAVARAGTRALRSRPVPPPAEPAS
jgi:hypothetical protein